ncbi:MAG: radical SAM protein [Candidatus Thermoplasmatota archaeon]|nr:radical SAM protein [Candidatus Thermoplasmatota archaeon]
MRILLVMPHPSPKRSIFSRFQYPSSTLQQIAAITPDEHQIEIVDERYEDLRFSEPYDLVGISILTYNAYRGYEIADIYRQKGIPVVFGGYHASLMPEEVKQHADSVVIGEAELTWPQLLLDLKQGQLKPFYSNSRVVKAEEIPAARHDIGNYTFWEAVQASRGCPTRCEFCAMNVVEGKVFRGRPIDSIIEEMKQISAKKIFFADASLTINPKYSKELFKAMIEVDKKYHCFGNINVLARDDEFLRLSHDAGVEKWYLGIESISQQNIDQAGKGTNKVENYAQAIKKIRDHDMIVTGFFIFGLDFDTVETFDATLKAIYEWELDEASFSILTPYPGTRLFDRFEKDGLITNYDWSQYEEGKVNFKPKNMTPDELLDGIRRIAMDFYSVRNSVKRSFNVRPRTPSMIFSATLTNLSIRSFYKREKFNK